MTRPESSGPPGSAAPAEDRARSALMSLRPPDSPHAVPLLVSRPCRRAARTCGYVHSPKSSCHLSSTSRRCCGRAAQTGCGAPPATGVGVPYRHVRLAQLPISPSRRPSPGPSPRACACAAGQPSARAGRAPPLAHAAPRSAITATAQQRSRRSNGHGAPSMRAAFPEGRRASRDCRPAT
jgi:hypothetical protein